MRRISFLLATAVALACSGSGSPGPEGKASAPALLAPAELSGWVADRPGAVVVDVRTEAEWVEGRIPGAVRVGVDDLEATLDAGAFPARPDQPVVVYCGSGRRSARAASILAARGFSEVRDLEGGMRAWTGAGLPIER